MLVLSKNHMNASNGAVNVQRNLWSSVSCEGDCDNSQKSKNNIYLLILIEVIWKMEK